MASLRQTTGRRSRDLGTVAGIRLNLFALDQLRGRVTGEEMAAVMLESAKPMYNQAVEDWPRDTGASGDSIELLVVEAGETRARIVLQVGGQKLANDPRNKSGIDYAPYLEFGSQGRHAYGVIRNSVFDNEDDYKQRVREGIKRLIEGGS